VIPDHTKADSFTEFVTETEERLRIALTATHGPDRGREAAAEALAYGWENWDRVRNLENPAGYLYRVGHNRARRMRRPMKSFPFVEVGREPWIEPGLPSALEQLPERQRTVVGLLHGMQWSMSEVAELLGVSKATVQKHADRGLAKLRKKLGVNL
jgi:RNA polymerase sigma-70 factor (ECF subfamily)